MKISFGMIFSIILIVIFLAFTFFAIQKFLKIQDSVKIGKFMQDIQSDVDKMWNSQGSQAEEYILPSKVKYVCFADFNKPKSGENQNFYDKLKQVFYEYENMFFYPVGSGKGTDAKQVKHLDIGNITENENPYCIENIKGKITMIIKKDYGVPGVVISK